jgi:heat-inducible transcriptional repressor
MLVPESFHGVERGSMTDLSDRQKQLLKAIIELYVKNGEPVGSEAVEKYYDLGVSPATIRNEMVRLSELGFLKQPHTSAGRIPTAMGFRLYIHELMREKQVPVMDEVSIRQQIMEHRSAYDRMLREATRALAKKCGTLALLIEDDGDIFYAGAANILDIPEFFEIDVTRFVLSLFDEFPTLKQILGRAQGPEAMHILFGEETEFEYLRPTSFAFLRFGGDNHARSGVIGVLGPARLNFPVVLPYLRYVSEVLTEAGRG